MDLDKRELATVLGALRFVQTFANWQNKQGIYDVATDGGTLRPLDDIDIDGLCERLNVPPVTPAPGYAAFIEALEAADSFITGFEGDETQEGIDALLKQIRDAAAAPEPRARVLVTVQGGSADVQTVGPVDYELLDFDNLEAEGLNFEERDARYQEEARWLETGELPPDHDDGESDITDAAPPCQHFGDTKDGHCVACGFDLSKL